MDVPRRSDRDSDPVDVAAHEQATLFRNALREEIQRLDADYSRLEGALVDQKMHRHRRLAAQTERVMREIEAERRNVNKMLSELERRFPED